jgi:hypothetical protein
VREMPLAPSEIAPPGRALANTRHLFRGQANGTSQCLNSAPPRPETGVEAGLALEVIPVSGITPPGTGITVTSAIEFKAAMKTPAGGRGATLGAASAISSL